MLPDLFAGEIAAMGRLLVKMSAALSRRALAEQDVLVKCRDAANELRAQALLLTEKCTKDVAAWRVHGAPFTDSTPRYCLTSCLTCLHHSPRQRNLWTRGDESDHANSH
jgi:hypothetical protein